MPRRLVSAALLSVAVALFVTDQVQAGCQYNSTQLSQLRQQAIVYANWSNTYCGRPGTASACQDIRAYIQRVNQILQNCGQQGVPLPGTNGGGTGTGGAGSGGGTTKPPQREVWYRSDYMERYLIKDKYGRWTWSTWQSSGHFENQSQARVETNRKGWLDGDPYKPYGPSYVSRWASATYGFYRN